MKEILGSQIAYKAITLKHKETKSVAKLLVVAVTEESLEQAIDENNITFLVNSFETLEGSSSENSSKQLDLNEAEIEPIGTVYFIFDAVTSEVEIKTYGLRFSTDENAIQGKSLRKPNWSEGAWIKSNAGAIGAHVQRLPSINTSSGISASFWITNCWLCGYDQRAYHTINGDYEIKSYSVGGVHKHAVYIASNWRNHSNWFDY